jgi:hypothetical protein
MRWWSVAFVVDEADARPLGRDEAFEAMHPREIVRSISLSDSGFDEPEDVASLKLELLAPSATAAKQRAEHLLLQGRRAVGLRDAIPSVAWVTPLMDGDSSSARFLEKAEEFLDDEDEQDMAVVAALIHLEVQVQALLTSAAERHKPGNVDALLNTRGLGNLYDKKTRALIKELLGFDVKQAPEWEAYKRHRVLRNAIVHEGQDAEPHEARSSVVAARMLCIRLAKAAMETSNEQPPF